MLYKYIEWLPNGASLPGCRFWKKKHMLVKVRLRAAGCRRWSLATRGMERWLI